MTTSQAIQTSPPSSIQNPEVRRRLRAYLKYGLTDEAAREAECSIRTLQRTWKRYRVRLADCLPPVDEVTHKPP